jgi:hypothetical protein
MALAVRTWTDPAGVYGVIAYAVGQRRRDVNGFDPVSVGVSTAILFVIALAACSLPARRAASVDPSLALRAE